MDIEQNEYELSELSEKDKELLTVCDSVESMVFLKALKTQSGSFVTNNEVKLIEELKIQSKLPDSVLNVLIHYIIVIKGCRVVSENLANTIANDWLQKGVSTSAEAMIKTRMLRDLKNKQYESNKAKYQQTGRVRKETLPEWAKEENKIYKETPISAEEEAFFKEQLRRLRCK